MHIFPHRIVISYSCYDSHSDAHLCPNTAVGVSSLNAKQMSCDMTCYIRERVFCLITMANTRSKENLRVEVSNIKCRCYNIQVKNRRQSTVFVYKRPKRPKIKLYAEFYTHFRDGHGALTRLCMKHAILITAEL